MVLCPTAKQASKIQKTQNSWISESNLSLTRTQEDVEEYGSLESAVHRRTVEVEKLCIETICIEFKCLYSLNFNRNFFRLDSGPCHE